jgi:hypothetical protein
MRPSRGFDWGRVVTPLRWFARIFAGGAYILWLAASVGHAFGGIPDAWQWMTLGILGAGLVLAIFWTGTGEIIGGLALLGAMIGMSFRYLPLQAGSLTAGAVFAVPGVLFIVCGWYTLVHPHVGSQPRAPTSV